MKLTLTTSLAVIGAVLAIAGLLFLFSTKVDQVRAGAGNGIPATSATTTPAAVTTTASTIFATSTCTSRVISTVASPIMLTFTDAEGKTPTGVFGHLQAASTTVAYDAEIYGCGAVKAYSFVTSTITVTENR